MPATKTVVALTPLDEIKANLRSIETASAQTLELLRSILGQGKHDAATKASVEAPASLKAKKTAATKISGVPKRAGTRKPPFEIHESAGPVEEGFKSQDRR